MNHSPLVELRLQVLQAGVPVPGPARAGDELQVRPRARAALLGVPGEDREAHREVRARSKRERAVRMRIRKPSGKTQLRLLSASSSSPSRAVELGRCFF